MTPAEKVELLRACCCVAGADQLTGEKELPLLQKLAVEIGVGKASLEAMISRGESDSEFHRQQFKILKADPAKTMATLIEVALADDILLDSERTVLKNLADNLNVLGDIFDQLIDAAQSTSRGSD